MNGDFFKNALVAINCSQSSIHASMYAIIMAKSYNLKLKFVYVVDTATIKYLSLNKFLIDEEKQDYISQLTADGSNYLTYIKRLSQSKGINCETELLNGGVYSEIIKSADDFKADLIILGGHETDSSKRNSVSEAEKRILLSSHIPVLVVQKPEIERLFNNLK